MQFVPCQGKTACRDDGSRCLTCGRSLEEIEQLRRLLGELADMAMTYDYANVGDFSDYVARKVAKTVAYRRESNNP